MRKSTYNTPKKVLVFNGFKKLIAIVRSLHSAAELSGISPMAVSFCCAGKSHASNGYYFRYEHPDILILLEDLEKLKLEEYDDMCGQKRIYRSKEYMERMKESSQERKNKKINLAVPGKNINRAKAKNKKSKNTNKGKDNENDK